MNKLLQSYLTTNKRIKDKISKISKEEKKDLLLDSYNFSILIFLPVLLALINLFIYTSIVYVVIVLIGITLILFKTVQKIIFFNKIKIDNKYFITLSHIIYIIVVIIIIIIGILVVRQYL